MSTAAVPSTVVVLTQEQHPVEPIIHITPNEPHFFQVRHSLVTPPGFYLKTMYTDCYAWFLKLNKMLFEHDTRLVFLC